MIRTPKTWRITHGHTLAVVAERAGITGENPSRTYSRYENGERDCPAPVVEAVRKMSQGEIGAEHWQAVRVAFLGAAATAKRKRRAA